MNERIRQLLEKRDLIIPADSLQNEMVEATAKEIELFVIDIVQELVGITQMLAYRNGLDSKENTAIAHVRKSILRYFNVEELDVNDIFDNSEYFREHFKLPRKGDRTWP